MTIHIGECPLGIFAFDENRAIVDSEAFPKETREIANKMYLIQQGEVTDEHIELVEKLNNQGYEEFSIESRQLASKLKENFENKTFEVEITNLANEELRRSIRKIAEDFDVENVNELLQDVNILMTREALRREASERDNIIIQTIDSIDELDEAINTLYGRIREWYGIHFPELERRTSEPTEYFELILELGRRENFTKEALVELEISEEKAEKIKNDAKNSVGAGFDEMDIEAIQKNVERILSLQEAREENTDYLDGIMEQVAPNIKTLVGSSIGARLISLAGGLEDLAKMPSSTVQVLGAEKALFRSLNKGAKPPKHGVIFQYPDIRGAPEEKRGKIARALSGKLVIAARVDAMSGKFVGDELKKEVEERVESIKRE